VANSGARRAAAAISKLVVKTWGIPSNEEFEAIILEHMEEGWIPVSTDEFIGKWYEQIRADKPEFVESVNYTLELFKSSPIVQAFCKVCAREHQEAVR
jgi:hypothetical protein